MRHDNTTQEGERGRQISLLYQHVYYLGVREEGNSVLYLVFPQSCRQISSIGFSRSQFLCDRRGLQWLGGIRGEETLRLLRHARIDFAKL